MAQETSHSPAECTTLLRWSSPWGTEGSNPSVSAEKRPRYDGGVFVKGLCVASFLTPWAGEECATENR